MTAETEKKVKRPPAISYRWIIRRIPRNKQVYMQDIRIVLCSIFVVVIVGSASLGCFAITLPSSMATVHPQIASRHKATSIADQEHRRATVFFRARQTTQHVLLGPFLAALGKLHEQVLDHLGDDVAGADGVDTDVVLAPFGGEVAAELDDGCFGSIVGWADETLFSVSIILPESTVGVGSVAKGSFPLPRNKERNTLFAIVPLILAIMTMLPPFPNRIICLATACAVMNTPVTLTSIIVLASLAEYSNAGVSC